MSEKKSWDIQPSKRVPRQVPAPTAPAPVRRAPTPVPRPRSTPPPVIRREKVPQGRNREPLRSVRRRQRRRTLTVILIILLLLIAGAIICLWLPAFRIQHVDAAGLDESNMQAIARSEMIGTYEYVLPRNSIFFFPLSEIRAQILAQYPEIAAVAISRESFNAIGIDSIPRETAFIWCGTTYVAGQRSSHTPLIQTASSTAATSTSAVLPTISVPTCYDADSQGFIFAQNTNATSTLADTLHVYGPLAVSTSTSNSLLAHTVSGATYIPNALEVVKVVKSLGISVVARVLRGDEADLDTQAGTRITYVLGQEAGAAQLAQSAFPSLNLNDGSLEYVDLRFNGKVYFKKTGGSVATSTTP